jgi:ABC-type nitrate/sulfonate/bicarbonate transport system substrate-binding protein
VARKPRAMLGTLLALAMLAMLATACGDDDGGEDEGASGQQDGEELTPITVGILPLSGLAPVWYGVEQGYFADEGLDVSMEIGSGGAALAPAVLENDYQFAVGEYISLMLARENDVPVQVVSNLTNGADAADQGINALLVSRDSGIESVDDLAGKTIAVNGLGGVEEVAIRAILDDHGVDDSGIEFTELDFPDMNAAVEAGDVDVAAQPEPFVTLGEQAGLVNLLDPFYEALPSLPLGLIFASEDWLGDNPELAEAFNRALQRSIEAASDDETMREVTAANTDTEPDVVQDMALDRWDAEVDRDNLQTLGELAARYGVLEEEPNLDELVWEP